MGHESEVSVRGAVSSSGVKGSVQWESLLGRAVMALDEEGVSAYAKSKLTMARKRERAKNLRGGKLPFDFYTAREVMVEYDRLGRFDAAVRKCGGVRSDVLECRHYDEDVALVWDYIRSGLSDRMRMVAVDIAMDAQESLGEAVREKTSSKDSKYDIKAIAFALERGAREVYGEDRVNIHGVSTQSAKVVYNMPNLTVNMITAPAAMLKSKGIEVEAVEVENGEVGLVKELC